MNISIRIFGFVAICAGIGSVYVGLTTTDVNLLTIAVVPFAGGIAISTGINFIRS